MKKIIVLSIAAAALLCSCAKVNPQVEVNSPAAQKEVNFQVAKAMSSTKTTKAGEFNGTVFNDVNGFGAYAWQTGNPATTYFMNAQQITKQQVNSVWYWKPQGTTYYWPKEGTVDFECFAPYNNGGCWFQITDDVTNTASNGKANKITAHLQVSVANPCADLMYSDKAVNCNSSATNEVEDGANAYTGVPVIFRHALAMSKIQIKASEVQTTDGSNYAVVTFKNATLKNVRMSGDLVLSLSTTGETNSTRKWVNATDVWSVSNSDKADYVDTIEGDKVINTTPTDVIGETIIIPQALSDQAINVDVVVDLYQTDKFKKDADGNVIVDENGKPVLLDGLDPATDYPHPYSSEEIIKNVDLKDLIGENDKWEIGENTNYTITIAPFSSEITFDPCVAPWAAEAGTPTIYNQPSVTPSI